MRSHFWLPLTLGFVVILVIGGVIFLPSYRTGKIADKGPQSGQTTLKSATPAGSPPGGKTSAKSPSESKSGTASQTDSKNGGVPTSGTPNIPIGSKPLTGSEIGNASANAQIAAASGAGKVQQPITDHTISGMVINAQKEPLSGAEVTAEGAGTVKTESNGNFVLKNLPGNSAALTASMPGYNPLRREKVPVGSKNLVLTLAKVGSFAGRVLNQFNEPIAAAGVSLQAQQGVWAVNLTADNEGRFEAEKAPSGKVHVAAVMEGFKDEGEGNKDVDSPPLEEVILRLHQPSFSISGRVILRETQQGIQGFWLSAKRQDTETGEEPRMAQTDGTGFYIFDKLRPGTYLVSSMAKENANNMNLTIPIDQDFKSVRAFEWDVKNVNFEAVSGLQVSGTVTSSEGRPAAGAEVSVAKYQSIKTLSGADGRYTLNGIPSFSSPDAVARTAAMGLSGIQLFASHAEYGTGLSDTLPSDPNADLTNINIQLRGSATLLGTLMSRAGAGVPDARVLLTDLLQGSVSETRSDSTGAFRIDRIPTAGYTQTRFEGTHTLEVFKEGYAFIRKELRIKPGDQPVLNLTMDPAGIIRGRVMDNNNKPLSGVQITAYSSRGVTVNTRSDAVGFYQFDSLSEGVYDLMYRLESNPPLSASLYQVPLGSTNTDAILTPTGGAVMGTVVNAETNEIINYFILTIEGTPEASPGRPFVQPRIVNTHDGTYQITLPEPGNYLIRFTAPNFHPTDLTVRIGADTMMVQFLNPRLQPLKSTGGVAGTFLPPPGTSLSAISVLGVQTVQTAGNDFLLENLPAGKYDLLFYVRENDTMLGSPIGVLPSVIISENQTTNLGQIPVQRLNVIFRGQ